MTERRAPPTSTTTNNQHDNGERNGNGERNDNETDLPSHFSTGMPWAKWKRRHTLVCFLAVKNILGAFGLLLLLMFLSHLTSLRLAMGSIFIPTWAQLDSLGLTWTPLDPLRLT